MRHLDIEIPDEIHKSLKEEALQKGTNLQRVIIGRLQAVEKPEAVEVRVTRLEKEAKSIQDKIEDLEHWQTVLCGKHGIE